MSSAVCTLFEGNYHYGVGVLSNSLFAHGFRGTIYAGYRGALPPWIKDGVIKNGCTEFSPADGITIKFVPLSTTAHLTNYKPDFMLALWRDHCPEADSIFYFDPDITIICSWAYYELWARAGVALCADINPSMPENHPLRFAWKEFYQPHGINFRREPNIYFNGGFFGLPKSQIKFLHCWQRLQELMFLEIGGANQVNVRDRTYFFHKTDQDALNVAAMVSESPISPMGQDGMDFQHGGGGFVMSHALGGKKPWNKPFLKMLFLRGSGPSRADRAFFRYVKYPISLYSPLQLAWKHSLLMTASLLGRFVGRA